MSSSAALSRVSLKIQPHHVGFLRGVLMGWATRAWAMAREGRDPGPPVTEARKAIQRARELQVPLSTLLPYFMDALLAQVSYALAHGQDTAPSLGEAGRLLTHLDPRPEDPVELGTIRLRYLALMLQAGHPARPQDLMDSGKALARSLVSLRPVNPGFWMALAQFHDACGDPDTAARARARGRALNPRWCLS